MPESQPTVIEGRVERITFRSDETHFMIAKFRVKESHSLVTVLGHFPEPRSGETLRLKGHWNAHPRYGQQFKVTAFDVLLPAGVEEIRRYLSCGLIKGIGPKTTERLIAHFKQEALVVIENTPERLSEVKGIGRRKARRIGRAWQEHHAVRALMQFLQNHDIKPAYGARIYKTYGVEAMDILRDDPYRVAGDLPRIGFYIADAIVRHSDGIVDETRRARACIRHLLEEAREDGHMYVPRAELEARCHTDFQLDFHALRDAVDLLIQEHQVMMDPDAPHCPIYLQSLFDSETGIASRLQALLTIPMAASRLDDDKILAMVVQRLAIRLSETQLAVLQSTLDQRVVIITGGPGTGKTTLIRSIAAVFEAVGRQYLLAAPTGRAARRMAEITGRPAATLHRLLGFNLAAGHFERDQDNPLDTQALIVDEASMVDAQLMGSMIKALPHAAMLILVGDAFQLPSVGPGTVLADLIQSQMVKTFALQEIFRQTVRSPIVANAHKVRNGELPILKRFHSGDPLSDFVFIEQSDPNQISQAIIELCSRDIPRQMGLDGIRDVQVLTPMHKGNLGTLQLNRMLQAVLNPRKGKGDKGGYRLGDKVMHLRNNYQKEVFNGEIGTVSALDADSGRLTVSYDHHHVDYDDADLDELTLAYAISVHKSQGSEYPVIIMPIVTQHYVMLQRNLLYTALTRAKRMVILIGTPKAVRIAVQADAPRKRRSLLAWRLNPDVDGH